MQSILRSLVTSSLVFGASGVLAHAQCPRWQNGMEVPGVYGGALALTSYDDGSGTKLYAGGSFVTAGRQPVSNLVRWTGLGWETFGGAGPDGQVFAFQSFDDGSGPALFVAGTFMHVGGTPATRIARWNGSTWASVGGGIDGSVYAMAVFDDGTGPALYAAGVFGFAGGVSANAIARWNGTSWSPLGSGLIYINVSALAVFDDGSGPALYAGGYFHTAGGVPAANIARWRNGAWTSVAGGTETEVRALCVHDDGSGPALYAGGGFTTAGGMPASRIARFKNGAWSNVGAGFNERITSLASLDDGSGPKLYASGRFTMSGATPMLRLARWDGSVWSQVGDGVDFETYAMASFDDRLGGGPAIYLGTGKLGQAGSIGISRWTGAKLVTLTGGGALMRPAGALSSVAGATVFDDGSGAGSELYVSGDFEFAGSVPVNSIALWNGWRWRPFPGGPGTQARTLGVYDDGSGPALAAWGTFPGFQGVARWTGSGWMGLGSSGPAGPAYPSVSVLEEINDGSGPALYAAGFFFTMGGVIAGDIARFQAGAWSPLGGGLNRATYAIVGFDDGSGPAIFAGGEFTQAAGIPANAIAKWQNGAWSTLGSGLQSGPSSAGVVQALVVFDDGTGPALYAGGNFSLAGGVPAANVARWKNGVWSPLGAGVQGNLNAFLVHDDGTGPALFAAGSLTSAGGVAVAGIARFDGTSWTPLGAGIVGTVVRLQRYGGGLYAAGGFVSSGGVATYRIAQWQSSAFRDCNGNGIDDACDIANGTSMDQDRDGVPDSCQPASAESLCAGDGSGSACPCANLSASGRGCPNSIFPKGALLEAFGTASLGADTLRLAGSSMPNSGALYAQGTQRQMSALGAGTPLGDGLRCVGGSIVRLGSKLNAGNASQYPGPSDPSISQRGGVLTVGRRVYQAWYRNAAPGFCTPATWNLTNAIGVDWTL